MQQPNAFVVISWNFNHVTLDSSLLSFTQYVDCHTRENKTLDLLYANAPDACSTTALGVGVSTVSWITDYLTGRPQYIRLNRVLSDVVLSGTGTPQGTVLSPFLFTLYTSDFQYNTESCYLQKFSDDSAVVGCINDGREEQHRELVDRFAEWPEDNHLLLNVDKTKVIDFRKKGTTLQPWCILGRDFKLVEEYKYLGVTVDSQLKWKANSTAVYKKGCSRLYFLRKLRSFNVCSKMLEILYQCVIASTLFSSVVCWGSSITASDTGRLNKLIRKAGSVIGCRQETFEPVVERRALNKLVIHHGQPGPPSPLHTGQTAEPEAA